MRILGTPDGTMFGGPMRKFRDLFIGSALVVVAGCGNLSDFDEYGNPLNVSPGANFRIEHTERSFSARGLTRCQFTGANNGLGVIEMAFLDNESDSELRINLVGFNPENEQHQIVGMGKTSGGDVILKTGGDQRMNTFRNQSSNGRGNSSQCQFRVKVQGSYVQTAFQCYNLFNQYGQPRNASGEARCRTEQYAWE